MCVGAALKCRKIFNHFLRRGRVFNNSFDPSLTFNGRWPSMEDDLQGKTTFDGSRPSMEDDLLFKTTFNGRRPSMEDVFDGRWVLIKRFQDSALPYTAFAVIFLWNMIQFHWKGTPILWEKLTKKKKRKKTITTIVP